MADLNSTLVRGNLRVTEDTQVSGSISEGGTLLSNKYLGKSAKAADADKLDGNDSTYFQKALPTTTTANKVLKSTSTAGTVQWADDTNTNQTVKVGSTTFGANDAVGFVAGTNITSITADASAKTITINAKDTTYSDATTSASGLMSASDKTKLNGIASGATAVNESTVSGWGFTKNAGTVTQVKVGTTAYDPSSGVVSLPAYPTKSSWNYDDVYVKLTGNQTIAGTKTFSDKIKLDDGANSYAFSPGQGGDVVLDLVDEQSNKTTVYLMNPNTPSTAQYIALRSWVGDNYLGKTATAADSSKLNGQAASYYLNYNNFTNTPTIPTVNNGTLTIQGAGTAASTFTANQSTNTTLNIKGGGTTSVSKTADNEITVSSSTVRYDTNSQGLNATQKTNARTNIGAGTSSFSGSYNDLTDKPTIPSTSDCIKNNASGTISVDASPILTLKRAKASSGAFLGLKPNNQDTNILYFGATSGTGFAFSKSTDSGSTSTQIALIDSSGNIYEGGSADANKLANKYLGKTAKAADSDKLDGNDSTYFINTSNIGSQSVSYATSAGSADDADYATNAGSLNGNGPAYYLNYNNFTNTPTIPTESTVSGWGFTKNAGTVTSVDSVSPSSGNVALSAVRYASQSLNDTQKAQARTNIGAGTSDFTGYTSSNKLSTSYIQNDAGWSSFSGYTSSNKLSTNYIQNDAGWSSFSGYTSSNKLSTSYIQNDAGWTSNAGTITGVTVNGSSVATSGVASFDVTAVKTQTSGSATAIYLKMWKGTQAQYNSISSKDSNTLYVIV